MTKERLHGEEPIVATALGHHVVDRRKTLGRFLRCIEQIGNVGEDGMARPVTDIRRDVRCDDLPIPPLDLAHPLDIADRASTGRNLGQELDP